MWLECQISIESGELFTKIQSDLSLGGKKRKKENQWKHSVKNISIMNFKTNERAHIGGSHHFPFEKWLCYIQTVNEQSDQCRINYMLLSFTPLLYS